MAQTARRKADEAPTSAAELLNRVANDPACVLTDEPLFQQYMMVLRDTKKAEAGDDLETEAGRERIKSAAYSIARVKSAIDNAGKAKTEHWRAQTAMVNAQRKIVQVELQALQDEIRLPVTEWERAAAARKAEADGIIERFQLACVVRSDETSADVQARLDEIRGINLNDELFGPRIEMVTDLRDEAVSVLTRAIADLKQREDDLAELERLREAAAERDRQERIRLEREAEEAQKREAERLEQARKEQAARDAAAQAERDKQEAVEAARREAEADANRKLEEQRLAAEAAEEAARAAAEERRRTHDAEIAAANAAAKKARQESDANSMIAYIREVELGMIGGNAQPYGVLLRELEEKIAVSEDEFGEFASKVEDVRVAALQAIRNGMAAQQRREAAEAEDRRRQQDRAHRDAVKAEVKNAVMTCGADEETARKIVLAIIAEEIPHVSIRF